jgi:hypothetical protein
VRLDKVKINIVSFSQNCGIACVGGRVDVRSRSSRTAAAPGLPGRARAKGKNNRKKKHEEQSERGAKGWHQVASQKNAAKFYLEWRALVSFIRVGKEKAPTNGKSV